MLQEMGREPTPEELAVRMEMPEDKVRKVLKIAKQTIRWRPDRRRRDPHLGDFIEDKSVESPIDSATTEPLRETTHSVLAGLTPREAKVLRMRFGIDMTTDHTLEEVGKQFDVTRERIRQIEAKALRKLRHPRAPSSCAASSKTASRQQVRAGGQGQATLIRKAAAPAKAKPAVKSATKPAAKPTKAVKPATIQRKSAAAAHPVKAGHKPVAPAKHRAGQGRADSTRRRQARRPRRVAAKTPPAAPAGQACDADQGCRWQACGAGQDCRACDQAGRCRAGRHRGE